MLAYFLKMESDKNSALFGMIEEKYGATFTTSEVHRGTRERSSRSSYLPSNQRSSKKKSLLSTLKKMVRFNDLSLRKRRTSSPTTPNLIGSEFHRNSPFRSGQRRSPELDQEQWKVTGKSMEWWDPPEDSLPVEFCRDTSLHGLKYVGQSERHLSERIFWLLTFVAGLSVAAWLISEMWMKYKRNPIIVSFQPYETNVDQIPFPAVTVCNMNKVMRSKAVEFLEKASNGDVNAKKDVYYLDHVCSSTKSFAKRFNYTQFGELSEEQRKNFMFNDTAYSENLTKVNEFLRRASQNCSDMIPLCVWQDQEVDCSQLFRPIETEFGKCCTFNMIPLSLLFTKRNDSRESEKAIKQWQKWDVEADGLLITASAEQLQFPRRQMKAGLTNGLSFLLNVNSKEYYCTSSDSVGFRMATHLPVELPKIADFGISLPTNSEIFVDVAPEITMVDPDIYAFSLDQRNCYKRGEYNLRHFMYYSVNNCIDECIANDTRSECGCKRYYMPRNVTEPLCGPHKFECAEDVKFNKVKNGIRNTCSMCLQSCSEILYEPKTSSTPIKRDVWKFTNGSTSDRKDEDLSIVHVFIGQDSFYAKVRKELYGKTDLFANTGGLMGLFLGFSGLSLIELVYFLTLRAWWKSRKKQVVVTETEEEVPKWITSLNKVPTNERAKDRNMQSQRTTFTPSYQSIFGKVNRT